MVKDIYLFHGKGGSPNGSVRLLEQALRPGLPDANFVRVALRHGDPNVLAEDSLAGLAELEIAREATVIGISLGGLVAAKFQETKRPDLVVVCVSSPTWADGVSLEQWMPSRASFYSSKDDVISGRTEDWPRVAQAFDIPILTHDTDLHVELLSRGILGFLRGEDVRALLG